MNDGTTQDKGGGPGRFVALLKRVVFLVALGCAIGWTLNRAESHFEKSTEPAGFVQGVVQGALMPIALPNLAFGHDVTIYAEKNTGRNYKMGYTIGVNGCGLIFFGFFFWRVRRLRRGKSSLGA